MDLHILRGSLMAHQITRWHMLGQYQKQDVAQHSFRVAFIAAHIADLAKQRGVPGVHGERAFVLGAIHDLGETITGDIPSHVKSAVHKAGIDIDQLSENQGFYDVPEPYKWIVKGADIMEAALFTGEQYNATDSRGRQVAGHVNDALVEILWHGDNSDETKTRRMVLQHAWDDLQNVSNHKYNYSLKFEDKSSD